MLLIRDIAMNKVLLSLTLCGVVLPVHLEAVSVFSDNFNSENGGSTSLNYSSFANFTISDGSVDLISAANLSGFAPANGLYVDLDGSTGNAGVMTSVGISLIAGDYILSFDLAGSRRTVNQDTVQVSVETGFASATYVRDPLDAFTTESLSFSLAAPATINLVFSNSGGDNVGALLDNINLEFVPAAVPDASASAALLTLALSGLHFVARRRK